MRSLARLVAAAALVAAGGLTLPGGAAQAAACSGTTGVTVVIDYGSTSSTLCAPGDPSSAMGALKSVATVVSPQRYPGTVVCRINGTPASDPCIQMPPASAYWAFFHAPRGGSWTYSQSGVASYNPAPGTVLGFAFGSGGKPDTAPPAAVSAPRPSSTPKPSTTPSPKPSTKPSTKPSASSTPRSTSSTRPGSTTSSSPRGTSPGTGTSPASKGSTATKPLTGKAVPSSGSTTATVPGSTPSTSGTTGATTGSGTTGQDDPGSSALGQAAATAPEGGSPTTLFAGIGLVGVVGAAAAYLTHRRRHPHG